jgi:hypothetical protein
MPAANSFFPLLNSCLAQNFKKNKKKQNQQKQNNKAKSILV